MKLRRCSKRVKATFQFNVVISGAVTGMAGMVVAIPTLKQLSLFLIFFVLKQILHKYYQSSLHIFFAFTKQTLAQLVVRTTNQLQSRISNGAK